MTEKRNGLRRLRVAVRYAGAGILLAFVLYVGGFFLFLADVAHYRTATASLEADGIVVLTGGHARVDEAVKLLNADKGERLLISGVHPSASRKVLLRTFAVDEERFACCVDIDREALDTMGNAAETAHWAADHGFSSLIVVTNDYHMPRSLLELRSAMDDVKLIPHAVASGQRAAASAEEQASRYRVLFGEYVKYSAARMRTLVAPTLGIGPAVHKASLSPSNR